jgi:two-component system, LytTR family, sensor kinase
MSGITAASLVNLLGFITGIVLYGMLLSMVLTSRPASNRLTLLTGTLGFSWNIGAFGGYALTSLGMRLPASLLLAAAFSALCFLPAVLIHSALRASEKVTRSQSLFIVALAYVMSGIASLMHFYSAITIGTLPSPWGLRGVTIGFGGLLFVLLLITGGQRGRGRVLWVVALSVFAVSALHLSNQEFGQDPWWLQLAGHHASVPLALLILYQDFRFALADIFLKRALSLLFLVGLIFGLFVLAVFPILAGNPTSERSIAVLLAMWGLTALAYPFLRRAADWLIDTVILKRMDYAAVGATLSRAIDECETPDDILHQTARILAPALSAQSIHFTECEQECAPIWVHQDRRSARIAVLTVDAPHYIIHIGDLAAGRRLLSDDMAVLERAAFLAARRIDATRSTQERYRRDLQEQEMRKLAAEAELRALRAQINPHFLFNALTTIGYLIQTAPDRALGTLMQLSGLLRGVLRSAEEFISIGDELSLIEAYLDIERARFEDRLRVRIDVPWEIRELRIPALILQPLVENAIKHGISESVTGGEVHITARFEPVAPSQTVPSAVLISVTDTGPGVTDAVLEPRNPRGVGLSNVERRLQRYGAGKTPLLFENTPGKGTKVEIRVPLQATTTPLAASATGHS